MSTKLLDLNDRIVTSTGSVVAKYDLLIKKALSGEVFTDWPTLDHPDVRRYYKKKNKKTKFWQDNGNPTGPDEDSYEWNIPDEFRFLDIEELCISMMEAKGLLGDEYVERVSSEFDYVREHNMEPFLRCLLYIIETFRNNNVVWGIGRGSSCASLILFIFGINRVDPVRYDIPMEEFYK